MNLRRFKYYLGDIYSHSLLTRILTGKLFTQKLAFKYLFPISFWDINNFAFIYVEYSPSNYQLSSVLLLLF